MTNGLSNPTNHSPSDGKTILVYGDISNFSFHQMKVYQYEQFKYQPANAANREQYLQMLRDGIVGENTAMTLEQYNYEIEDHLIFQGLGFVVYKWYGNEFFISSNLDETGEYAFYLRDIENTKVNVTTNGIVQVSWDKNSTWPKLLDYIEKDGFPVTFKVFKDYGRELRLVGTPTRNRDRTRKEISMFTAVLA